MNKPTSRYYGLPLVESGGVGPAMVLLDEEAPRQVHLHTLVASETLDLLSLRYYGREDLWWRIADANPPRFPGDWQPGDVLRIPSLVAAGRRRP